MLRKIKFRILLVLILQFVAGDLIVFAQNTDSLFFPADSNATRYFFNQFETCSPIELTKFDTTLIDFEIYNPVIRQHRFAASLGNAGLAYKNREYIPLSTIGFDYGIHTFDAYLFNDDEIKYYINPRPFSEVAYVTGAKKEQLFNVRHDQRVFRMLTLGLDFELINSQGTYQRQKSDDYRLATKAHYFTDNLRYGIIANFTTGRVKARENGGILYDTIYEDDVEPSRSIIPVKLTAAQNTLRKSGVYLQQYFQLSTPEKSHKIDTVNPEKHRIRLKFGRLTHSFNYKNYSMVYADDAVDPTYYPDIYQDSISTYDSVHYRIMENNLSWSNADYINRLRRQPILVCFGIKSQISEVNDSVMKSGYSLLIPYGSLELSPTKFLVIKGKGSYVTTGDNYQGDFTLNASLQVDILRTKSYRTILNVALNVDVHEAPYFYQHYFSNHFRWNKDFTKEKINTISGFVAMKKLKTGFDIYKISDYLYFDHDTLPAQYAPSVEILKLYLSKQFRIGKFDIDGSAIYQKVSEPSIIRLPELMGYLSLTFNLKMFKGALHTRSGFDFIYYSRYLADGYIPALRSFYLQDEKKIGNFVHTDFFINFNVKRTRFFMKLQNIGSVIGERNYYEVPHYPMQDLSFKFGLSWHFHD